MSRDVFGQDTDNGGGGDTASPTIQTIIYKVSGTLATGTGKTCFVFPVDATLVGTNLAVDTAPTGDKIIIDVNLNNNSIYSTQSNRPFIAMGGKVNGVMSTPDTTFVPGTSTLAIDIDQVGPSAAGADLIVCVQYYNNPV